MRKRKADVEVLRRVECLVEAQRQRLGLPAPDEEKPSRRGLLKMMGAAILGAAGGAALRSTQVSAAQGGNMIIGQTNVGTLETVLNVNGTSGPSPVFAVTNSDTSGLSMDGIRTGGKNGGTGLLAFADSGVAVMGVSTTGPDISAGLPGAITKGGNGTGRLAMRVRGDTNLAAPNFNADLGMFEIIRGTDGSFWTSRNTGSGQSSWKRINSVRVDSAANDGNVFVPARVINTDPGIGPVVGGITGPLAQGNTYFWTLAGTNGIPADAIGIVGNITAAAYTSGGFLTMFPSGLSLPTVSSVNFSQPGTVFAWGNHFTVGFGRGAGAGAVAIYVGLNTPSDTCHVIVDVFGYIQ